MDNDNKLIVVKTTSFPITTNLQTGNWTNYLTIEPPAEVLPTQEGTEIYPVVTVKDAKTKKYLNTDFPGVLDTDSCLIL